MLLKKLICTKCWLFIHYWWTFPHKTFDIHCYIFDHVLTKVKVFNIQVQSLEGWALILASVITIILKTWKENNYHVKSTKDSHNASLQKLSGHWALSFGINFFEDCLQFSTYLNITNTSCDWLTKGLDLKTFCCFVNIV